jgi:HTH-type transcriptional regulator / antitoxin HigA
MANRTTAQAFPPGEFIKEELEARGWTQGDLAKIMKRQDSVISAIIKGKRAISAQVASELAAAFGTSAELWMNLETSYRLFSHSQNQESAAVSKRARLFAKAPVKDMIRRNWIPDSSDLNVLEREVCEFFGIRSIDEDPGEFAHAAKKSTAYEEVTPAQKAWLYRARKLARAVQARKFSQDLFSKTLENLRRLLTNPENAGHVARILAEGGVRFLIVESLPHAKIDGACFWLDEFSPVVVLAIRYDRLDNFWYVLMHECGHVRNQDGLEGDCMLDVNIVGDDAVPFDDRPEIEKRADVFATNFLVDPPKMDDFIARVRPMFSKRRIIGFAMRIGVHPAIVLGQLQYRREVDWSHSREMLVKVREIATSSALTDGFGQKLPAAI